MSARALLSDGIDGSAPALIVAPTEKGSTQTLLVGDPPVSAAKHLVELLEDYPAGYAGAVAAWRIVRFHLRQQGRRLIPDRFYAVRADLGHGVALVLIGKVQYLPG
jgi:hypothetical protein